MLASSSSSLCLSVAAEEAPATPVEPTVVTIAQHPERHLVAPSGCLSPRVVVKPSFGRFRRNSRVSAATRANPMVCGPHRPVRP
jgi:hypothetical protein